LTTDHKIIIKEAISNLELKQQISFRAVLCPSKAHRGTHELQHHIQSDVLYDDLCHKKFG
jgi:hypothetical protein